MSERIRELRLSAFRGVPDEMLISLGDGESLVIYGDNGTGKSTIADALEWYFTGEIELLSHEGRQHAVRHLGSAGERETAVELETGGELSGRAVFPDRTHAPALELGSRETFLLRGRTLADFINKSKTEKWRSLADILGLDRIDGLRQDLQRVRTELRRRAKATAEELEARRHALRPDGGEPSEEALLLDLGHICEALGIEVPATLERLADPTWLDRPAGRGGTRSIEAQRAAILAELEAPRGVAWDPSLLERWNDLVGSERPSLLRLLESARSYVEGQPGLADCPLCGQQADARALGARLEQALLELASTAQELDATRAELAGQIAALAEAEQWRDGVRARAALLQQKLPAPPASPDRALLEALEAERPIDAQAVERFLAELERWDESAREIGAALAAAPEADSRASEDQLAMLLQLCQQIEGWRAARHAAAHAARARDLADAVYAAYEQRQQAYLRAILDRINGRVAEIYERLHPGEGLSEVSVEPWTAKGIELVVNFHGSRQRPPHGVLSESHLNSLAIALFLAMADTFNERLGFLVLDDVINSFDLEHRGSLADLLAITNDRQLLVLTHDLQFFEHLTRRAPSWRKLELTSWSYEEGPRTRQYRTDSLLAEARERLESGDTNGAATKTRRALEEQLQEVCAGLQALLPFRRGMGNDRRELGELFKGLRRALKEHARSWLQEIDPLLTALEADVAATLNVEAHASRGRATAQEVEAALERTARLDQLWSCAECGSRIWSKGTPDSARCRCGHGRFPPAPGGAGA